MFDKKVELELMTELEQKIASAQRKIAWLTKTYDFLSEVGLPIATVSIVTLTTISNDVPPK